MDAKRPDHRKIRDEVIGLHDLWHEEWYGRPSFGSAADSDNKKIEPLGG